MGVEPAQIKTTIDSVFVKGSYFYNEYIVEELKSKKALEIISEIIEKSGKTTSEAILILLASIRYYYKNIHILAEIEQEKSFQHVLENFREDLIRIAIPAKVQSNTPDRALPLLEVLYRKLPQEEISIIELGSSYGLIGSCLLHPEILTQHKNGLLAPDQQMPQGIKKANFYLGIDINPPEKNWLLACFSRIDDAVRIENYIKEIPDNSNFRVLKGSAIGFSKLKEVKEIATKNKKVVVLTSFMLYQFSLQWRKQLTDEILEFCKQNNGNWIAQEVDISDVSNPVYYIDFDEKRIISLQDDKCGKWKWVN